MEILYGKVSTPPVHADYVPVVLSKETMREHREKVSARMREEGLEALVVYGDREHGANYAYLTGFEPRFEESVLVLHADGRCYLMLGNENLKMCQHSFIQAESIHVPHFSLPNQPMETTKSLKELFADAGIRDGMRIGCAGWKMFTSRLEDNEALFDLPSFIMEAIRQNNPGGQILSAGGIFLDPEKGVRVHVNANEIAHYEFGAGLASLRVWKALNQVAPGKTELEIADNLAPYGQPVTVTTICAAGERFTDAVVFPRNKEICLGDRFSVTLGLRGGLTSRAAYVAMNEGDLPENVRDYVERLAKPYYRTMVHWYEKVGIGGSAGELYEMAEKVLPRETYHWTLNPGHLTGAEEWTSSPVYPGSKIRLKSGMMLQVDIIPSLAGYGGANAEDGIALADEALRRELQRQYPRTWERMEDRRRYMKEELGIELKEEVLPLSDLCGYMRPYLLNREWAFKKG